MWGRTSICIGLVAAPLMVGFAWMGFAQDGEEELAAEPVVVTATRTEQEISDVTGSITVIEQDDIQLGRQTLGMSEPLRGVPGVYVQNQENFAGDLRLSIRGFGSRGRFGIQGIRVLVDGIPETTADGQSNVDSIEMGAMERIEVLRGPSASLYGASAGGVVSFTTERPPEEDLVEARLTGGSFGFFKQQIKAGTSDDDGNGAMFNLSNMQSDGFRDHNRTEMRTFYGKIVSRFSETSELTTILSYFDSPTAEDPQGLTREELEDDREQARPDGFFAGAATRSTGEEVVEAKGGLVWKKGLGDDLLTLTGYRVMRTFSGRIVPRIIEFERLVVGGGAQYILNSDFGASANRLVLGVDIQQQTDRRRNFGNDDGKHATDSCPGPTPDGPICLNQVEKVRAMGVFVNDTFAVSDGLSLNAGVRNDTIAVSVDDNFRDDGDQSGSREFEQTSFSVGANLELRQGLNLFANLSQAFEIPTLTQLDNPTGEGGFNDDLDPQVATSLEVGLRSTGSETFNYEVAVFQIVADDEIVVFQDQDTGIDFFRNAGETQRVGAEAALVYRPVRPLTGTFTLSYIDAEYVDFETTGEDDDGNTIVIDYDGNTIPGIPAIQAYLEVAYKGASGFYVIPEAHYVGEIEVDDANTDQSEAYTLVNVRVGYLTEFGGNVPFSLFGGVNNVTDEEYNQNVRVNDFGGRFFEPGPPTTFYVGVSLGLTGAE